MSNENRKCIICGSRGRYQPVSTDEYVLCMKCNEKIESEPNELIEILDNSLAIATDINRRIILKQLLESIRSI